MNTPAQNSATQNAIAAAVQIMRSHPKSDDDEIFERLLESGIARPDAIQVIMLVPLAYTRAMLVESGVLFSEMYACCDESGKVIRNDRLDRIPLWNQALAFAKQEMSGGVSGDAIGLVAGRSAEFDAVNQALHDGSSLKNLVCGPPVFAWGEFHNSVASGPAAKSSRRWWQLWETEEVYTLTRGQRTVARVTAIVAILIALAGVGGVVYLLITFLKATN